LVKITNSKFLKLYYLLAYYEVCEKILNNSWTYVWNDQQKVPFAHSSGTQIEWVGFEDVKSIEYKLNYIKDNNLGGAMIWALDMDDFMGTFCNQGKYPILNTINYHLNKNTKARQPSHDSLWSNKKKDDQRPIFESDMIQFKKNSSFSTISDNVITLMQQDPLQIYKFCQCKNGTHKINQNNNPLAESYTVDCNFKRIYSSANQPTDHSSDYNDIYEHITKKTKIKDENQNKIDTKQDSDNKYNSIWSIFGFNAAGGSIYNSIYQNLPTNFTLICIFYIIFLQ
jgi:hypothetical protein